MILYKWIKNNRNNWRFMNIILVPSSNSGGRRSYNLSGARLISIAALIGVVLPLIALFMGVLIGQKQAAPERTSMSVLDGSMHEMVQQQRNEVEAIKRQSEENLNALAIRLGEMQARVARLDAVGRNLVARGDLDDG